MQTRILKPGFYKTEGQVALDIRLATSFIARLRGLLGYPPLVRSQGLWLFPCNSVHTFGMTYPLDILFLDRHCRPVKAVLDVPAWRILVCTSAVSVMELPAGGLRALAAAGSECDNIDLLSRLQGCFS